MDPLTIAGLLTGAANAQTNMFESIYGMFSNERDYNDTRANIALAREREDNAVQRRAADLKKAGLNPLLAVGSPASSMAPIRAGGVYTGKTDFASPIIKAAELDINRRMAVESIANARAQNTLLTAQAAKTEAEKAEVDARTDLLRNQATGTAAQTELTNRTSTLTEQKIKNAAAEYLQTVANTQKVSVETAFKELEKQIVQRDTELLKRMGLLVKPPSGPSGTASQVGSFIFSVLDNIKAKANAFNGKIENYFRPKVNLPGGSR